MFQLARYLEDFTPSKDSIGITSLCEKGQRSLILFAENVNFELLGAPYLFKLFEDSWFVFGPLLFGTYLFERPVTLQEQPIHCLLELEIQIVRTVT